MIDEETYCGYLIRTFPTYPNGFAAEVYPKDRLKFPNAKPHRIEKAARQEAISVAKLWIAETERLRWAKLAERVKP